MACGFNAKPVKLFKACGRNKSQKLANNALVAQKQTQNVIKDHHRHALPEVDLSTGFENIYVWNR